MFQFYKQTKCLFECRLKFAAAEANCIPWDYPQPEGLEGEPICRSRELHMFETAMDSAKALDGCDCPPDCHHTVFKVQASCRFREVMT